MLWFIFLTLPLASRLAVVVFAGLWLWIVTFYRNIINIFHYGVDVCGIIRVILLCMYYKRGFIPGMED